MVTWVKTSDVVAAQQEATVPPDPVPVSLPVVVPSVQPDLGRRLTYAAMVGIGIFLASITAKLVIQYDPWAPHPLVTPVVSK